MKNIIILYHDDLDGFGAAWAAWKKFGNKADYLAVDYTKSMPTGLKNKEIYILDFCYPEAEIKALLKNNKKLVVIDHHVSRKEIFKLLKEYVWNINRAGCVLSWKYFHPGKKIPKLIEYVEDIDMWTFKLKNTNEITLFMESLPREFKVWNKVASEMENKKKFSRYLEKGEAIAGFVDKIIEIIASNSENAIFEGKKVSVVNSPNFNSELGAYLLKKTKNPIAIIWSLKNGVIRVSLRSLKSVDVSKLAQKYGGGGHRQAAGFSLSAEQQIPWRTIK
ncbi:MAG: DHHA1 domain-containing protein [Candidatus Paceibacterota bacterium]